MTRSCLTFADLQVCFRLWRWSSFLAPVTRQLWTTRHSPRDCLHFFNSGQGRVDEALVDGLRSNAMVAEQGNQAGVERRRLDLKTKAPLK